MECNAAPARRAQFEFNLFFTQVRKKTTRRRKPAKGSGKKFLMTEKFLFSPFRGAKLKLEMRLYREKRLRLPAPLHRRPRLCLTVFQFIRENENQTEAKS